MADRLEDGLKTKRNKNKNLILIKCIQTRWHLYLSSHIGVVGGDQRPTSTHICG